MFRASMFALLGGCLILAGGSSGQDTKKKDDKGTVEKGTKAKGVLPANWGKIGLTDDQKQNVYKIQSKYNVDIDKLDAKIKELKGARDQEMKAVLNADQKKKLEEILMRKSK